MYLVIELKPFTGLIFEDSISLLDEVDAIKLAIEVSKRVPLSSFFVFVLFDGEEPEISYKFKKGKKLK